MECLRKDIISNNRTNIKKRVLKIVYEKSVNDISKLLYTLEEKRGPNLK